MDSEVLDAAGVTAGGSQEAVILYAAGVTAGGSSNFTDLLIHTHYPWLDDFHAWMTGHVENNIKLFDCSELLNVPIPHGLDRDMYLINLFFQKRYLRSKKAHKYDPLIRASPKALCEAWISFVNRISYSPHEWLKKLIKDREDFFNYNFEGMKMDIHIRSISIGIPCCVMRAQKCPMCYVDSPKATEAIRSGAHSMVSTTLYSLIRDLDIKWNNHMKTIKEDEDRTRMLMEDNIFDDSYLAQLVEGCIEQRLRDVDSEVYRDKNINTELRRSIRVVISDNTAFKAEIATLKDELRELTRTLYEAGVVRSHSRPRLR